MRRRVLMVLLMLGALAVGHPASAQLSRVNQLLQQASKAVRGNPAAIRTIERAETMIAAGQFEEAARLLDDFTARHQQVPRTPIPVDAFRRLEEAAEALRREERSALPAVPPASVPPRSPLGLADRLTAMDIPSDVPDAHRPLVVGLQRATGNRPFVVTREQKQFLTRHSRGAAAPDRYLDSCVNAGFSRAWRLAPAERRVFLIGPGKDAQRLRAYATELRSRGYLVFFYLDWEVNGQLCPSEVVGAYFATAGEAVVSQSLNASESLFVPIEITLAQRLRAGEELWYVYTPAELLSIGLGATGTGTVTVYYAAQYYQGPAR